MHKRITLQILRFALSVILVALYSNLELAENNLVLLVTTEECENEEHLHFAEPTHRTVDW